MNRLAYLPGLVLMFLIAPAARAVTIDTVPVGNAGNANDPATGSVYGGVAYNYYVGKTEVTVGQYAEFLNAVAGTDTYGLYNASMGTDLSIDGIARSGVSGNYTYTVIGSTNHPVTYVSWGDAARFSNWLHNGQPNGPQNVNTTEGGAYTLNGAITDAALNSVSRNAGAQWFIPTYNEWYKGAYYQPALDTYSTFPSYYGQDGGNVVEWTESWSSSEYAIAVGFIIVPYFGDVVEGLFCPGTAERAITGFRIASVPEPSGLALAAVGLCLLVLLARHAHG